MRKIKKISAENVLSNDELMVGSKCNHAGLLWYACTYDSKLLPDDIDEKTWDLNEIKKVIENGDVPDEYSVSFSNDKHENGYYRIKKAGESRFIVEKYLYVED